MQSSGGDRPGAGIPGPRLINARDYAIPEDFFALAEDVILHRMRLTYEALAEGRRGEDVLQEILRSLA